MAPILNETAASAKNGMTHFLRTSGQVTSHCKAHLRMSFNKYDTEEQRDAGKLDYLQSKISKLLVTAEIRIQVDHQTLFGQFGVPFQGGGSHLDNAAFQLVFANVWRTLVESLAKTRSKVTCEAATRMSTAATMLGHATDFSQELVRTTCHGLMAVIETTVETACNVEYVVQEPHYQAAVWEVDGNDIERGMPEMDGQGASTSVEMDALHQRERVQRHDSAVGVAPAQADAAIPTPSGAPRAAGARSQQPTNAQPPPATTVPSDPEKAELHQRLVPTPPPLTTTPQPRATRSSHIAIDRDAFVVEAVGTTAASGMAAVGIVATAKGVTVAVAAASPVGIAAALGAMVVVGSYKLVQYCQD
ncbi:hypothetical protein LTR95_010736 [Oleoguttula sp. CCFEE 5521]